MGENAFVTWAETSDPWLWEDTALRMIEERAVAGKIVLTTR